MAAAAADSTDEAGKEVGSSSETGVAQKPAMDKETEERLLKAKVQKLKRDAHVGRVVRNNR